MTTARIDIHGLVIDDQTYGASADNLVSRANFDVTVGGRTYASCSCSVTQPKCSDYENNELELGPPEGYPDDRPWAKSQFHKHVARYYRRLIGEQGRALGSSGSKNASISDLATRSPYSFEIELPSRGAPYSWMDVANTPAWRRVRSPVRSHSVIG